MKKAKARSTVTTIRVPSDTTTLNSIQNFEIHITCPDERKNHPGQFSFLKNFPHWKLSYIKGDPLLGTGSKAYLTTHTKTLDSAKITLASMKDLIDIYGYPILRLKIEAIVFDTKKSLTKKTK